MIPLDAFARHCDRHPLDRRPTIWATFTDIWGESSDEIGIPNVTDARLTHSTFALLSPWALVPTMQSVWLVVDRLEWLEVVNLKATPRGYFEPSWRVGYVMEDDGSLTFDAAEEAPISVAVGVAIQGIKRVRKAQTLWDSEYTFNTVLPVVEELLHR